MRNIKKITAVILITVCLAGTTPAALASGHHHSGKTYCTAQKKTCKKKKCSTNSCRSKKTNRSCSNKKNHH